MAEEKLKVVLIDDNEERKKNIREILPQYMDVIPVPYGSQAIEKISPDFDKRECSLIIMNADDRRGQALYMFNMLVNDEGHLGLDRIPVLILTEDEFSDRVMSFLEIGDVEIYEGDINPDDFFLTVTSIINEAEFRPEPKEVNTAYVEKNTDRIYGRSVKPEGEHENAIKRSAIFNNKEQLEHLETALERGRKKQALVQEIMEAAINLKEEKKSFGKVQNGSHNLPTGQKRAFRQEGNNLHNLDAAKVSAMLDDTLTKYEEPAQAPASVSEKTIAVVDSNAINLNICDMYLKRRYRVVLLNSSMSAIDYFVKNKADLLLISYEMPMLDGVTILDSIRWQPNGKRVPAIFMTEGNPEIVKSRCRKEWVVGMLQKPLSQTALKQAVEAVFCR